MKKKLLVFHRAIAPYRIDFFNALAEAFDMTIYFEFDRAIEQSFRMDILQKRFRFTYNILPAGSLGVKNLRLSALKILRHEKPDIVLCSELNILSLILCLGKRLVGNPPLVSVCDDNETMARQTLSDRRLKRLLFQQMDGVVLCDKRALSAYEAGLKHPPRMIFYPIVQDEAHLQTAVKKGYQQRTDLRAHYGVSESDRVLLFVGRLSPEKNLPTLLQAFDQLQQEHSELHLFLVGDGPLQEELALQAASCASNNRIHFIGKVEGDRLWEYYALADLCILPSTREAFGAVVNEALIAGVPCVVSEVAGGTSLLNETNGASFNPTYSDALYNALSLQLSRLNDAPALTRPSLVPESFHTYTDRLIAFLNQLIA